MHAIALVMMVALPQAKISKVVVYPDRAQVTRALDVECSARATATFSAIPPAADPTSFRAHASVGAVEGLRYEAQTRAEEYAPEVKELEAQIRKLDGQVKALRDAITRTQSGVTLAGGYTDVAVALIGREMSEPAPNTKAWGSAFELALSTRQKAAGDVVELGARIRTISHKLDELRRKRALLSRSSARRELTAEVLISCPEGRSARVELSYIVGGASWSPAYEARADEAGGAVELSTFATVRQSTGENWSQAQVILSTAVPRRDATPPEIAPLRVYATERAPEKKVLVRREENVEHAEAAGDTPPAQPTSLSTTTAPPKETGLRAAAQGLSVQLAVPDPADISGDDRPARLFVGKTRMPARFALKAAPKMMPFAFRVADLVNRAPYPLLAGPLDAFRKGGLIARYPIERVAEGQLMHLTFGIEESVRAQRYVVSEAQRDVGLLGSTRRFKFVYKFELANFLDHDQELELSDHVPVSELDDLKIWVDNDTTQGYERRDDDGIVTWHVKLKPGEKRRVDFLFHIDVPSKYDSGQL